MTGNNRTLLIITIILGVIICLLIIAIGYLLAEDFLLTSGTTSQTPLTQTVQAPEGSIPFITIIGVVTNISVTFEAQNFPSSENVAVSMGKSTEPDASKYYPAGTGKTDSDGKFSGTYNIPQDLQNEPVIILYLQSETGYYAYTPFKN
jgi:hypothetical protein